MKCILVATDFSVRSDRAVRRATLLAKQFGADLVLLHAIDGEQPAPPDSAVEEAATKLDTLARTLRRIDGVACKAYVLRGDVSQSIARMADETGAELLVLGPYRQHLLTGLFGGTTTDRTIRAVRQPVLMANALPAGAYGHVLFATDFSPRSVDAAAVVRHLGLDREASLIVVHAFDSATDMVLARMGMDEEEVRHQVMGEASRAERRLRRFVTKTTLPALVLAVRASGAPALAIRAAAKSAHADLIVVAAHDRSGLEKLVAGSVTDDILRSEDRDVLVIPPAARAHQAARTIPGTRAAAQLR